MTVIKAAPAKSRGNYATELYNMAKGTPSEADKGLLIAFAMLPLFAIVEAVVRAWL